MWVMVVLICFIVCDRVLQSGVLTKPPPHQCLLGIKHSVLAWKGCQWLCLLQRSVSQPQGVWRTACSNEGGEWTQWRLGGGGADRNTESGVEEVRGMDLLVSCLCWSAEQAHKTEDKHFCFCCTTATPIWGREQRMWVEKEGWLCSPLCKTKFNALYLSFFFIFNFY